MTHSNITRRGTIAGIAAGVGLASATVSGDFVRSARAQSARKTFVLVHGTFCGGWAWRRVSDHLEKNGHKVFAPTLTGLGERSHLLSKDINLDTHITDIVNVIKWESLEDPRSSFLRWLDRLWRPRADRQSSLFDRLARRVHAKRWAKAARLYQ